MRGTGRAGTSAGGGVQSGSRGFFTPSSISTEPLCHRFLCASDAATVSGVSPSARRNRLCSAPCTSFRMYAESQPLENTWCEVHVSSETVPSEEGKKSTHRQLWLSRTLRTKCGKHPGEQKRERRHAHWIPPTESSAARLHTQFVPQNIALPKPSHAKNLTPKRLDISCRITSPRLAIKSFFLKYCGV